MPSLQHGRCCALPLPYDKYHCPNRGGIAYSVHASLAQQNLGSYNYRESLVQ